jgi:hypothetical protein
MPEIYRWRKRSGTGTHYFKVNGEKHRKTPASPPFDAPMAPIKPFIDEYDCLGKYVNGDLVPMDDHEELEETPGKDDITLEVVAKGRGYFDVINPDNPDKPINDKGLRKEAAYKLAGLEIPEE